MTRRARIWTWSAVAVVLVLSAAAVISVQVLKSPWFANYVREKIVSTAEEATGGKVEIGSFEFNWRHLQATIGSFVLHGTEGPSEPPLFAARKIEVRLTLLVGVKKPVELDYLGVDQPSANVMVYPDGHTNIPEPKTAKKSGKNGLETIVDLAIDRFEVSSGSVALAERKLAFSLNGRDLQAQLSYRGAASAYEGDVKIGAFELAPRAGQPLVASVDLPVEIGKDRVTWKNASITTHASKVSSTGSLSQIDQPVVDARVIAHISLAEVQRTSGMAMDVCKPNLPCFGDADVEARADRESVQISKANVTVGRSHFEASGTKSTVELNGSVALDEVGRIFRVSGEPYGTITLTGTSRNVGTSDFAFTGNIVGNDIGLRSRFPGSLALSSQVIADSHRVDLHQLRVGVAGGEIDGDASLAGFSQFQFDGRLRSLTIQALERQMRMSGPGYAGSVNGSLKMFADLKAPGIRGLQAEAQLAIVPGSPGTPISGKIQAAYEGARNTVRLGPSYLALPHSRLQAAGVVGSRIVADFSSTSLEDLNPVLEMSKEAPREMPVTLHAGTVSLHAEVTGPLASPNVAAHLDATRFSVEHRPFDRLDADISASPSEAALSNGTLTHQSLHAEYAASLGLRNWAADNRSAVNLALSMNHGDLADVLALAGKSDVPARGSIDLSAQIGGTLADPQGKVHFQAGNGALFDQPFDKAEGNVVLTDQTIRVAALDVSAQTATLHADGTYTHPRDNLLTGLARVHLIGNGLEIGQITALNKDHPGLGGSLQINAAAEGNVLQSQGETEFAFSSIHADLDARGVRDQRANYGDLTAHADTSGSVVNFHLASNLAGSSTKVTGHTTLIQTYPTVVDLSISDLHLENALALAGETVPAKGIVTATAQLSGPVAQLTGYAQLDLTAANLYDEPVNRLRANLRYTSRSIEIPSLRIETPAGSLTLDGSFSHPENKFDSGQLAFHAASDTLRLAQIRNLQDRKPGIGGTLKLTGDFAGDMKTAAGGREFSVAKVDAHVDATGIAYNGRNYGNATVVAETKANTVVFTADSNFAGAVIHGDGSARLEGDYPVTAKVTLTNARYSNVREWFDNDSVRPGFEALLDANASIAGQLKKLEEMKDHLQVTRFELDGPPRAGASTQSIVTLKNDGPMELDYDRGSMRIVNAHLTGKSTDITIGGSATLAGAAPLNLTVKANTDLGLLQDMRRDIRASGSITIDAVVRGKFSQPLANGTVQVKNASFNVESLTNGISNANGVIALTGSGADIRSFSAESGGGRVTLSGFAALNGSTLRYSLNAKAAHVRTRYEGISVVNSGTLTFGGTSRRSLISGSVAVERVVYNTQSDIGSMLSQLTTSATPNVSGDTSSLALNTRLDIHIRTAPDVRFETSLAQTLQADADLTLGGTLERPGMVGRINITQGDLIFFGNEYTVDRGLIAFYDPTTIDPHISIDLETTLESVTVTLGITGPMNNLKLSYHSDPPLQFEEIVSLLTSGTRPSSDPNIVATEAPPPQQSVAQMGESAIVSQAVASPLTSRLQRIFGVNQLRIDPTFASGSALPQERVSLQQRVANSITFTYTQDLSQSNSELVRVEWAVDRRFSVVATRDENGIFGVDFFYKRQFR